jgi:hypothetical protein
MTEQAWLTVVAPDVMLSWVAPRCSARKLRLFAVACCRRVAHRYGERLAALVDFVEANAGALIRPNSPALPRIPQTSRFGEQRNEADLARALTRPNALEAANLTSRLAVSAAGLRTGTEWEEQWFHAAYLWDLLGNPFRFAPFAPEWRTDTVVVLARQMYESREFSAMPILADALQDAGCDSEVILSHCRDAAATHICGCWVVDLVLGLG